MPVGQEIDFVYQVKRKSFFDAREYAFTRINGQQASGDLSSPGSHAVTLSPVPLGVNGTDAGHRLYISSGTGTAEAVTITGGTAVAGAASGTIIFTTANAHSGAWEIQSATGGVQEAVIAAVATGGPATIVLSPSNQIWYDGVYLQGANNLTIEGNGAIIDWRAARNAASCFNNIGSAGATTTVASNVNGGGGTLLNDTGRAFNWTNTLTVASATGMAIGGFLWLQYNDSFKASGGTQAFSQVVQIANIVGTTITTVDPIVIPLNTAFSGNVQIINPVFGTTIRNLVILGTHLTATNVSVLGFTYHANTVIENVLIQDVLSGPSSGGGLNTYIGFKNRYTNLRFNHVNTQGSGADFLLFHETSIQCSNVACDQGSFGPDLVCLTMFDMTNMRSMSSSGRAFKVFGCCWGKMANIEASRGAATGFSVQAGTYQVQVTNLVANYNTGGLGWGIHFAGGGSIYNTLTNVTAIGNNGTAGGGVSNDAVFGAVSGYKDTHNSILNLLLNENDAANSSMYDQAGGNTVQFADNSLAATAVAGAATAHSAFCQITTEALTTAAGSTYTLTLTNNRNQVDNKNQVLVGLTTAGSNTQGVPIVQSIDSSTGQVIIIIRNMHASQAFNGTLILNVMVVMST